MLFSGGLLGVLSLLLLAYCVLDVATTPAARVRTLPKPVWFAVLLLPVAGPVLWLLRGRPPRGSAPAARRPAAPPAPPDDDEVFLRQLRRRAEEQRRAAAEQEARRRREQGDERPG